MANDSKPSRQKDLKQPQDRKPKAKEATAKQDVNPVRTIEFYGHEYIVDTSAMDDIDVMEALTDARTSGDESNYMVAFVLMLRGILGNDSYDRWKAEQRKVHAAHKITDCDDTYEGACECGGRIGSYVMQEFIKVAGGGNS